MNEDCMIRVKEAKEELAASMFARMQEEVKEHEEDLRNSFNEYLQYELDGLERKNLKQIRLV